MSLRMSLIPRLSLVSSSVRTSLFFFNDTATTEIYTLSLHDALPISTDPSRPAPCRSRAGRSRQSGPARSRPRRSEEHTSELQSQSNLVCRLLLEKKKNLPVLHDCPAAHSKQEHKSTASRPAPTLTET